MRGTPVTVFDTSKSYIMSTNGSSASFTPSSSGGTPTSGAMAWNSSLSYNKGSFVSYQEKLYISTIDGNINHCPTIDKGYWKEFQQGGGGTNPIQEITGDAALQGGNDYICTNAESSRLSLPQGTENAAITIFAQELNSNASITILPYEGQTIMGQDLLTMETSYSSVKLLWMGTEWKVLSPFVPEMFESQENNENITNIQEMVDDTSVNVRLNNVVGGMVYRFTQPLDSFVLQNINYNINESIIIFKTSANVSSIDVPIDKIINHQGVQISLQPNKNYILRIQIGYLTYVIMA